MLARALLRHFVLPATERLTQTRFWTYYTRSALFDFKGVQERQALQHLRLSGVWNAALSSSLHCERLEKMGMHLCPVGKDDARVLLGKLPPLVKGEFRRHFPEGAITSQDRTDWRYVSTSGTTDDRLTVVANFVKRDYNRSSELHALRIAMNADVAVKTVEIPPNACNVVCGLTELGPSSFWRYLWYVLRNKTVFTPEAISDLRGRFERQVVLRRSTLPPIEPAPPEQMADILSAHLNTIQAISPKMLRAFPLYLLWLSDCRRVSSRSLPGLARVGPYGGLTSTQMINRITAGFGAPFANIYGTNELGTVAAACGHSPGMHIFEDIFLIEVFRGGKIAENGQMGRLVITDLTNTAMPLIRYEVGDIGRLHLEPCPCGRRTARLEVLGRLEETLATPAGPLPASTLADAFFVDPAVANFRLEETAAGCFEAVIVPTCASAKPDLEALRQRFSELHPGLRHVRVRLAPFVRPERSGKYRFVHPRQKDSSV